MPLTFEPFPKIPRLRRTCVITEKIDGTNAQVIVSEDGELAAGSRKRLITPEEDNFGFARWVWNHEQDLVSTLGPGRHFGEWWGDGIQRRYGLTEKRFSLFNTGRWTEPFEAGLLPKCLHVVPVLYIGDFTTDAVDDVVERLASGGSVAAPGFMDPEGVVIYHTQSGQMFKRTIANDEQPKGLVAA